MSTPTATSIKISKGKSNCWLYFNKVNPVISASCEKCLKVIKTSGNTSNLIKHLKVSFYC